MFALFYRLHREALKQSAIDPLSGKIDVSILTTGVSAAARQRRNELTEELKKLIVTAKGKKIAALSYQKLFTDIKESMQMVCCFYFFFIYLFKYFVNGFYYFFFFVFFLAGYT